VSGGISRCVEAKKAESVLKKEKHRVGTGLGGMEGGSEVVEVTVRRGRRKAKASAVDAARKVPSLSASKCWLIRDPRRKVDGERMRVYVCVRACLCLCVSGRERERERE
jgi:tartrate dehydratase alpha subunit/fumarate hydratase class I-like protein